MRPENVHISTPTTKKESSKVIWNGTWPPETVFVVFERWQKKGLSQDWREFKQVENIRVEGNNKLVIVEYMVSDVCIHLLEVYISGVGSCGTRFMRWLFIHHFSYWTVPHQDEPF